MLKKILGIMAAVCALTVNALATDPTMTEALTTVKTDVLAGLASVAPVAITIFGAFLVWKFGKKFFNSLAK